MIRPVLAFSILVSRLRTGPHIAGLLPAVLLVTGLFTGLCAGLALTACAGKVPVRASDVALQIAPGWQARVDVETNSESPRVRFVSTSGGFLADNGPNVVFFKPEHTATGRYSLAVTVHHLDSHGHPHGAGLLFGGTDLQGPEQAYTYFLVRGDGQLLIKTRSRDTTQEIAPWTPHAAVHPDDASGIAENLLRVDVGEKETGFFVNDVEVYRAPNASLRTDGIYGFRMVHDLKVLFAGLRCEG